MNLLRLRPTTLITALLLSQGLCAALVSVPQPRCAAEGFSFGKKKTDAAEADSDGTKAKDKKDKGAKSKDAKGDKESAADGAEGDKAKLKGKADKSEEPPKEKHMSKEEIKEEEELQAEYDAYVKQLSDALKATKTPFGSNEVKVEKVEESELSPVSIAGTRGGTTGQTGHLSLGQRLLQPKVYMPGHMMIGHTAEFTVKGRPGCWAALAMADKDTGAKPIYGQPLRLGPDRKVVALGKIPASGVLALKIFAPVAGDLVGGKLYFEAAIWPEGNPERLELALPVSSETQLAATANSVAIVGQGGKRRGLQFVPDSRSPYSRVNGPGLGSGSPI